MGGVIQCMCVYISVCEMSLDDQVNVGSANVFFINGVDGFSSMAI